MSDSGDAKVLADLVRTDRHNHRPVAGDSDLAGDDLTSGDAVEVLRVAPTPVQDAALSRTKIAAALRRGGRQRRGQ